MSPGPDDAADLRRRMVRDQIDGRGIRDERVLRALEEIPRHRFVPEASLVEAQPVQHRTRQAVRFAC